ncbi:MAG: GntR family transcriptional regulator [Eubacteriales bacterium]|nr:GntR family transcriptional regulator [Eubacteriales bacterium]
MIALKADEQPIFKKIIDSIDAGIASGTYARGEAIPSEPELCKLFSTTRMTVRRAIDALVNEGKLYRVQGKGTFVSHFELNKTYQKHGFTSNMRSLGVTPSSRVLFCGECAANDYVRANLELEPDEPVFCLKRVRMADLEPIAIERVWLSLKRFPTLPKHDFSQESLYEVLRKDYGIEAGYSQQKINAVTVDGDDARLLFDAKKGIALRMRNVDYGKNLRPIAVADSLYHGSKYTLDVVI